MTVRRKRTYRFVGSARPPAAPRSAVRLAADVRVDQVVKEEKVLGVRRHEYVVLKLRHETAHHHRLGRCRKTDGHVNWHNPRLVPN